MNKDSGPGNGTAIFYYEALAESCGKPQSIHRYFNHSVLAVLEKAVSLCNTAERESVGDKGCGIYLSLRYKAESPGTVAAVHSPCLENQVLAVHVWKRKNLRPVIHGHNGHYRIGPCALPCPPVISRIRLSVPGT